MNKRLLATIASALLVGCGTSSSSEGAQQTSTVGNESNATTADEPRTETVPDDDEPKPADAAAPVSAAEPAPDEATERFVRSNGFGDFTGEITPGSVFGIHFAPTTRDLNIMTVTFESPEAYTEVRICQPQESFLQFAVDNGLAEDREVALLLADTAGKSVFFDGVESRPDVGYCEEFPRGFSGYTEDVPYQQAITTYPYDGDVAFVVSLSSEDAGTEQMYRLGLADTGSSCADSPEWNSDELLTNNVDASDLVDESANNLNASELCRTDYLQFALSPQ